MQFKLGMSMSKWRGFALQILALILHLLLSMKREMQSALFWLALTLFFSTSLAAQQRVKLLVTKPCDKIQIEAPDPIELNASEKDLICGDKKVAAWKTIPPAQARYFLTISLQNRGYWDIEFSMGGDTVIAHTEQKLTLEQVRVIKSPVPLSVDRYWYPRGKPLTPSLLNEIENWVKRQLAENGYPCATLRTLASTTERNVEIEVISGSLWHIADIKSAGIPGLLGGVERRYDAFHMGDVYNSKKLELTSNRLVRNDLVLSSNLSSLCGEGAPGTIEQTLYAGEPRLISFGIGFDTEEYLITKLWWQNGRLLSTGSPLTAQASASLLRQYAAVTWDWYYLPFPSRHFLSAFGTVERRNERRYEEQSIRSGIAPVWKDDYSDSSIRLSSGPGYEYISTPRGLGKNIVSLITWNSDIQLTTHDYEYFIASPRSGHDLSLRHSTAHTNFGSNLSATSWRATTSHLWNVASWDPPIFVLELRTEAATTRPGKTTNAADLPASYRYHLGGSRNLRGFGREALPPTELGALSYAYAGSSLRLNNVIAYKLQPIVFADAAMLGYRPGSLDPDNAFWSPGFGLRWESPIGAMLFTLGHGLISGPRAKDWENLKRWQFYFSFGEQT
ncbi:MAG: BamA/TamA family outer membrane protein [Oligoflexales bacterium]